MRSYKKPVRAASVRKTKSPSGIIKVIQVKSAVLKKGGLLKNPFKFGKW